MADTYPTFDVDGFLAATGLNSDHQAVVRRLFVHPSSENIEWRQVRSLLEALGAVTEEHNGKLRVDRRPPADAFTGERRVHQTRSPVALPVTDPSRTSA
jgi:hypothetical protein